MADSPFRLRIVNKGGVGRNTKVYIDDLDVSSCFNAVTVHAHNKDVVIATLQAVVLETEFEDVPVVTFPQPAVKELLIKHGWTPPTK